MTSLQDEVSRCQSTSVPSTVAHAPVVAGPIRTVVEQETVEAVAMQVSMHTTLCDITLRRSGIW